MTTDKYDGIAATRMRKESGPRISRYALRKLLRATAKPTAYLVGNPGTTAPVGASFNGARHDTPANSSWPEGYGFDLALRTEHSTGPWCALQLNLEDIPAEVNNGRWPRQGMLWLFVMFSFARFHARIHFDPRPSAQIPWARRHPQGAPSGARWELARTYPRPDSPALRDALARVCPEPGERQQLQNLYARLRGRRHNHGGVAVGGWVHDKSESFNDDGDLSLILVEDQWPFGTAYVYYSRERGFHAQAETFDDDEGSYDPAEEEIVLD